jgi:putative ABC transport system permease protein
VGRRATLLIVLVLGVSAGMTAAALHVVAAYLWRPLPYPSGDRLVVVEYPRGNGPSPRDLMRVDAGPAADIAELTVASDPDSLTVIGGDAPFTTPGRWISGDVFAMFAITPILGRVFTREEAQRGDPLAVIGHDLWQEGFGGRADVIGRTITVRATLRSGAPETFTVVGVLPRRFWHIDDQTNMLLPLTGTRAPWLMRLRDGVPIADAARRVNAMVRTQVPAVAAEWSAVVRSARDAHIEPVTPMLTATASSVIMLALVALANLAFLQMARGVGRQREIAVRIALGAGRRVLVLQLLREGAGVGAIASLLAVLIAAVLIGTGAGAVEHYFGRLLPGDSVALDPAVGALTVALTVLAALMLSVIVLPASRSVTLAAALSGSGAFTDPRRAVIARQMIVTLQTAIAFCLLVGALLMVRTAWHLGGLDLGFDPRAVLTANLTLHQRAYRTLDEQREFFRALTSRLRQLPGVESAGLTGWLPFRIGPSVTVLPEDAPLSSTSAALQGVDPEYFTVLRMRLREGRFLNADDRAGRAPAAVISATLANTLWDRGTAIGRRFRIKFSPEPGRGFGPYLVVGVVEDARQSVMAATPPQVYTAFYQQPLAGNAFLHVRTSSSDPLELAPAVTRLVRDIDPDLAPGSISSLETIVAREGLRPQLLARVLAVFASLATVIAVTGLCGVSAWIAQRRQREAALRVALGGDRSSVAALLARSGLVAVGAGLLCGWIAAWPLSASIASDLRGVSASDVPTRMAVAILLMATSSAALLAPAWRVATENLAALLREQ